MNFKEKRRTCPTYSFRLACNNFTTFHPFCVSPFSWYLRWFVIFISKAKAECTKATEREIKLAKPGVENEYRRVMYCFIFYFICLVPVRPSSWTVRHFVFRHNFNFTFRRGHYLAVSRFVLCLCKIQFERASPH